MAKPFSLSVYTDSSESAAADGEVKIKMLPYHYKYPKLLPGHSTSQLQGLPAVLLPAVFLSDHPRCLITPEPWVAAAVPP